MGKPIEKIAVDVKAGDLIKINLINSAYVAYVWGGSSNLTTMVLRGLHPFGCTQSLSTKVQEMTLNIKNKTLEGEKVKSYEILERSKSKFYTQ